MAWKAGLRYGASGEHQKGPSKQEPGPGILVPEPKNNVCEQKDKEFPEGRSIQTTMKSQRHRWNMTKSNWTSSWRKMKATGSFPPCRQFFCHPLAFGLLAWCSESLCFVRGGFSFSRPDLHPWALEVGEVFRLVKCIQHQRQTPCTPSETGRRKTLMMERRSFSVRKAPSKSRLRGDRNYSFSPALFPTQIPPSGHVIATFLAL